MQLIIHIGTHKVGTSALQDCLRRNTHILADNSIYYARLSRSRTSNALARAVAKRRRAEAEVYFSEHLERTASMGADTMLISAESFFAMTLFFKKFNGEDVSNYWQSELEAIELLRSVLPAEIPTTLVVFFRRQDHFLESLYRQMIKSRAVTMPIEEFRLFVDDALDYWRHMEIWSASFPECAVYTYEQAANNVPEFFIRKVLRISNLKEFEGLDVRVNSKLGRDILEYKRQLNATEMTPVDRRMSNLACTEIAQDIADDGRFQDYLAPDARVALLRESEYGNKRLTETFSMEPFPPLSQNSLKCWEPYPGLSDEHTRELALRHARIRKSASYQLERSALIARRFIQRRIPIFSFMIPLGRSLLPRHRRI